MAHDLGLDHATFDLLLEERVKLKIAAVNPAHVAHWVARVKMGATASDADATPCRPHTGTVLVGVPSRLRRQV